MTIEQIRAYLIDRGYTEFPVSRADGLTAVANFTRRVKREEAAPCLCNDAKVQHVVQVNEFSHKKHHYRGVTVSITGEVQLASAGTSWVNLKYYNVKYEQLEAKLPEIEIDLLAAWNAVAGRTKHDY